MTESSDRGLRPALAVTRQLEVIDVLGQHADDPRPQVGDQHVVELARRFSLLAHGAPLLYNLMLESTGRLQKCRLYEMTANKTARSTISYLIVRDQAHENAYAKALETLGVNWRTSLPIPKTNAEQFPEVKRLLDLGLQSKQYSFDLGDQSEAGKIFQGMSPSNDGTELDASQQAPQGAPLDIAPERLEEFAPGADKELRALIEATAAMEMAQIDMDFGPMKSS